MSGWREMLGMGQVTAGLVLTLTLIGPVGAQVPGSNESSGSAESGAIDGEQSRGGEPRASASPGGTLREFGSGAEVPAAELPEALVRGWVVSELAAGESVSLWDVRATAAEPAVVLWGLSSEFLYAAVLSGSLGVTDGRAEDRGAGAGLMVEAAEAAVWGHLGGGAARVQPYSTRDLRSGLREAGREDLADRLEPAHRIQERRRFWGLVRPTNLNVSVPLRPEVESARRLYLLDPAVVGAKRRSASAAELSAGVARAFLEALQAGDAGTVAALLDPGPFEGPAQRGDFADTRRAYARSLCDQPWAGDVVPGSLEPTNRPRRFTFRGGETWFELNTVVFDSGVFVGSIQPRETR